MEINYYWVRICDYQISDELKEHTELNEWKSFKGTMLDEYYLCGEGMTRETAKQKVIQKSGVQKFAKPRKSCGTYALILNSEKFFYDRFNIDVDTYCFNQNCHKKIKGKMKDFPRIKHNDVDYYCCCHDCKREVNNKLFSPEGEFQEREGYETNGGVYGYIYHIYNRVTNTHYIGQTIYMPFFRWQEHVKSHVKGNICDLTFDTVTEVRTKSQEYLNSVEAWWIRKYIGEYGKENVMNISVPKITMEHLIEEYSKMIEGQASISL